MIPRLFVLQRDHDVTGVSGTGIVADGVQWPDGAVTIRWRGLRPSTVHWNGISDADAVHGHGGATRIIWTDTTRTTPDTGSPTGALTSADTVRTPLDPLADQFLGLIRESVGDAFEHRVLGEGFDPAGPNRMTGLGGLLESQEGE
ncbi:hypothetical protein [Streptomyces sp. XH2]|uniref:hypothetical protein n=1 Tax=Streptomyces sp. XH2 TaxID=3412483 RepID=UPI003C7D9CEB